MVRQRIIIPNGSCKVSNQYEEQSIGQERIAVSGEIEDTTYRNSPDHRK